MVTKEEAIKELTELLPEEFLMEYSEALDMAIEALEQEPCEDCISRQAVLDYIYNDLGLGDEENGKDAERQMELESSYKFVKSLPSVTPQQKMGAVDICLYDHRWIQNVSLLNKIRAEIEALPKTYPFINHFDTYVKEDDVLQIIDKYSIEQKGVKNNVE